MRIKKEIVIGALLLIAKISIAQKVEIGADLSRAYFHYDYKDYGLGYSNLNSANHGLAVAANIDIYLNKKLFIESGLRFIRYEQYYGTRLYGTAWEQRNPTLVIPAIVGYKFQKSKFGISVKGGFLLGITTENYVSDYYAMIRVELNPIDSLTRGTMYRDYTNLVPMASMEFSLDYKIKPRWEAGLRFGGAKGFKKITEFDIYYNDGNGTNDQRAKQWGYGNYFSVGLGVKYQLSKKNEHYTIFASGLQCKSN